MKRSLPEIFHEAVENPGVQSFLDDNAWLSSLLNDAAKPLQRHFPSLEHATLSVAYDKAADWKYLVVGRPATYDDFVAAQESMYGFDEEWLCEKLPEFKGKLLFTLQF